MAAQFAVGIDLGTTNSVLAYCLLDGDEAGKKAALRALPMAWKAGLDFRFYPLPEGSDPDDRILELGDRFAQSVIQEADSAQAGLGTASQPLETRAGTLRAAGVADEVAKGARAVLDAV